MARHKKHDTTADATDAVPQIVEAEADIATDTAAPTSDALEAAPETTSIPADDITVIASTEDLRAALDKLGGEHADLKVKLEAAEGDIAWRSTELAAAELAAEQARADLVLAHTAHAEQANALKAELAGALAGVEAYYKACNCWAVQRSAPPTKVVVFAHTLAEAAEKAVAARPETTDDKIIRVIPMFDDSYVVIV